jgi:hypothetical protein
MDHDQFALPFLDTTSLGGFGLYERFVTSKPPRTREDAESFETPVSHLAASRLAPKPVAPVVAAQDYRLAGNRRLAEGWKARAEDNLAAIRLAALIEAEGRPARPDEQERLARLTGFGATDLADKLFRRAGDGFAPAWEDIGLELEQLVSREELASLSRATQYAHYTPEFIVRAIWRALRRMGFDGGRVLEPGCGTGLFFALAPEALSGKLALTGVEMDATTARIAKLLYPNARIRHEDFTKAKLPELYDLAIGNPPFSDRTVRTNDPAGALRLSLHDYFIARSVGRPRRIRHLALDDGQGRSESAPACCWHGRPHRRRAPAAGGNARPRRDGSRGRHPVPSKAGCRNRAWRRSVGHPCRSRAGRGWRNGAVDQPLFPRPSGDGSGHP